MRVEFIVEARGAPKGSAVPILSKTTRKMLVKQQGAKKLYPYQDLVAGTFQKALSKSGKAPISDAMFRGPIILNTEFVFERPQNHFRKERGGGFTLRPNAPRFHLQAPDRDKLLRAVQDALEGVAYQNDNQVTSGVTTKRWGTKNLVKITVVYFDSGSSDLISAVSGSASQSAPLSPKSND